MSRPPLRPLLRLALPTLLASARRYLIVAAVALALCALVTGSGRSGAVVCAGLALGIWIGERTTKRLRARSAARSAALPWTDSDPLAGLDALLSAHRGSGRTLDADALKRANRVVPSPLHGDEGAP